MERRGSQWSVPRLALIRFYLGSRLINWCWVLSRKCARLVEENTEGLVLPCPRIHLLGSGQGLLGCFCPLSSPELVFAVRFFTWRSRDGGSRQEQHLPHTAPPQSRPQSPLRASSPLTAPILPHGSPLSPLTAPSSLTTLLSPLKAPSSLTIPLTAPSSAVSPHNSPLSPLTAPFFPHNYPVSSQPHFRHSSPLTAPSPPSPLTTPLSLPSWTPFYPHNSPHSPISAIFPHRTFSPLNSSLSPHSSIFPSWLHSPLTALSLPSPLTTPSPHSPILPS